MKPRQGNPRGLQVADQKIDARTKTGNAPDEASAMRTKPAHKSLITDVQKASSPPLRNHHGKILAGKATDRTRSAPALTEDIRAIQRTSGSYVPLDCFVANPPRNDDSKSEQLSLKLFAIGSNLLRSRDR
jgi:hypothetical protein